MRDTRVWRACVIAVAVFACFAAASCGDDSDPPDGGAATSSEAATDSPRAFAERVARAVGRATAKRRCAAIRAINRSSASDFDCPVDPALARSMRRFELVDVAAHGPAAIVDYKSGNAPDGASMLLYRGTDGNWGVGRFGLLNDVSARTDDERSRAGYATALEAYLDAIRTDDCAKYTRYAATVSGAAGGRCRADFRSTAYLAKLLRLNPQTAPRYLGGNDVFGFHSLEVARPRRERLTITTIRGAPDDPQPYRVLSVLEAPPA